MSDVKEQHSEGSTAQAGVDDRVSRIEPVSAFVGFLAGVCLMLLAYILVVDDSGDTAADPSPVVTEATVETTAVVPEIPETVSP